MLRRLQGVKRSVDNIRMSPYTTAEIIAVKVPRRSALYVVVLLFDAYKFRCSGAQRHCAAERVRCLF